MSITFSDAFMYQVQAMELGQEDFLLHPVLTHRQLVSPLNEFQFIYFYFL